VHDERLGIMVSKASLCRQPSRAIAGRRRTDLVVPWGAMLLFSVALRLACLAVVERHAQDESSLRVVLLLHRATKGKLGSHSHSANNMA